MATIINNPGTSETANSSNSNMGTVMIALVILVIAILFIFYGLPMLRQTVSGPQVNIPDKVDVNVQGGGK